MRIVGGKFSDYYDSAQGYGIDTTLVYVRKENHISNIALPVPKNDDGVTEKTNERFYLEPKVLGFCGTLYPLVQITYDKRGIWHGDKYKWEAKKTEYFYDFDSLAASGYIEQVHTWKIKEDLREFFHTFQDRKDDKLFTEVAEAPIFVLTADEENRRNGDRHNRYFAAMRTNPNLKELGFMRMKDAFTAFQEISMYLSNQLVKEKSIDNIADKYKIAGHGFDETSFRNPIRFKDLK